MQRIYHEKGVIHITQDGINFTISNQKEFLNAIKKINEIHFDKDEKINFFKRMGLIDLLHHFRKEQIIFYDRYQLGKY